MSRKKQQVQPDTATNGRTGRPPSREEFVQGALSRVNEKLSSAARQNLQANYELCYDYPNEYVAFLDDWEGTGRKRRLVRHLVGHAPEMKPVSDLIAALPPEDQMRINFLYITDPFAPEVHVR